VANRNITRSTRVGVFGAAMIWQAVILAQTTAATPARPPQAASARGPTAKATVAPNVAVHAAAAGTRADALDKPGQTKGAAAAATASAAAASAETVRHGIVVIEQAQHRIAVGVVLAGDGRIVTALSPLRDGNVLWGRYSDGTSSRLRVAATSRGWNIALLAPEDTRHARGLRASTLAAEDPSAHARLLRGNQPGTAGLSPVSRLQRQTLTGGDGLALHDVITFGLPPRVADLGSVLVDDNGDVLAVVSQACQTLPSGECRPLVFGVPVAALKQFLRGVPETAPMPIPWIGMKVEEADTGALKAVRISVVEPRGPAAALGLRAGKDLASADLLVAIDGVAVTSTQSFDELLRRRKVGERVRLLLYSNGHYREATAVLGQMQEPKPTAPNTAAKEIGY
jgi:serine protease Do